MQGLSKYLRPLWAPFAQVTLALAEAEPIQQEPLQQPVVLVVLFSVGSWVLIKIEASG